MDAENYIESTCKEKFKQELDKIFGEEWNLDSSNYSHLESSEALPTEMTVNVLSPEDDVLGQVKITSEKILTSDEETEETEKELMPTSVEVITTEPMEKMEASKQLAWKRKGKERSAMGRFYRAVKKDKEKSQEDEDAKKVAWSNMSQDEQMELVGFSKPWEKLGTEQKKLVMEKVVVDKEDEKASFEEDYDTAVEETKKKLVSGMPETEVLNWLMDAFDDFTEEQFNMVIDAATSEMASVNANKEKASNDSLYSKAINDIKKLIPEMKKSIKWDLEHEDPEGAKDSQEALKDYEKIIEALSRKKWLEADKVVRDMDYVYEEKLPDSYHILIGAEDETASRQIAATEKELRDMWESLTVEDRIEIFGDEPMAYKEWDELAEVEKNWFKESYEDVTATSEEAAPIQVQISPDKSPRPNPQETFDRAKEKVEEKRRMASKESAASENEIIDTIADWSRSNMSEDKIVNDLMEEFPNSGWTEKEFRDLVRVAKGEGASKQEKANWKKEKIGEQEVDYYNDEKNLLLSITESKSGGFSTIVYDTSTGQSFKTLIRDVSFSEADKVADTYMRENQTADLSEFKVKAKMLKDIQEYKGLNGEMMGGWKEGEIVVIPAEEADWLFSHRMAEQATKETSSSTEKIPIKEIKIHRAEGPAGADFSWKTVNSLIDASTILKQNSFTAPEGGAYDKHDVKITWEDGSIAEIRVDVTSNYSIRDLMSAIEWSIGSNKDKYEVATKEKQKSTNDLDDIAAGEVMSNKNASVDDIFDKLKKDSKFMEWYRTEFAPQWTEEERLETLREAIEGAKMIFGATKEKATLTLKYSIGPFRIGTRGKKWVVIGSGSVGSATVIYEGETEEEVKKWAEQNKDNWKNASREKSNLEEEFEVGDILQGKDGSDCVVMEVTPSEVVVEYTDGRKETWKKDELKFESSKKRFSATRNGDKIMDISADILERKGEVSGTQLEKYKKEFIDKVKSAVGKIDAKDAAYLEDNNYHTELKILVTEGLAPKDW